MTNEELGNAVQELVWRIAIEGTPVEDYEAGYGSYRRFKEPWCVVDKAEAEPEVNWPGRLVGSSDDLDEAKKIQHEEIGRLMRLELLPKIGGHE